MSEQPISQSRLSPPSLSRGLSVSSPTVKQDPSAQRSQAIGKALSQMSTAFAGAFGAKFKYDQAEELRKREEEIKAKKRQEDEFKIQGELLTLQCEKGMNLGLAMKTKGLRLVQMK